MSEKLTKIDASPEAKGLDRNLQAEAPKNVNEFEVLLARYKTQNPEGYEKKLNNGTFSKQAKTLGFKWGKEVPELLGATITPEPTALEKVQARKEVAPVEATKEAAPIKRGRPKKQI